MRIESPIFSAVPDATIKAPEKVQALRLAMRRPVIQGFKDGMEIGSYVNTCFTEWQGIVPQAEQDDRNTLHEAVASLDYASDLMRERHFRKPPAFLQSLFDSGLTRDKILRITAGNLLMLEIEERITSAIENGDDEAQTFSIDRFSFTVDDVIMEGLTSPESVPEISCFLNGVPFISVGERGKEIALFVAENLPRVKRVPDDGTAKAFFFLNNMSDTMGNYRIGGNYILIGTATDRSFLVFEDKVTALQIAIHELRHGRQFSKKPVLPVLILELDASFDRIQAIRELGDYTWEKRGTYSYEGYRSWQALESAEYQYNSFVKRIVNARGDDLLFVDHNIQVFEQANNNRVLSAAD